MKPLASGLAAAILFNLLATSAAGATPGVNRFKRLRVEPQRDPGLKAVPPTPGFPHLYADSTGAGMGAECACADITGTQGEAITSTRATTGTCEKSDGTIVTCAVNAPRVEYNGSLLSILSEQGTLHVALRTEEFDNAAWTKTGVGVAAPVVTADQAAGRDGTTTADKIDIAATVLGTDVSVVSQDFSATNTASIWNGSVWLATASGTATVYQSFFDGAATYRTVACSVTSTPTRCKLSNKTLSTATWTYQIGVDLRDAGQSAQGAKSVFAWGASVESAQWGVGHYAKVVGTAVQVNNDNITIVNPLTALSPVPAAYCLAATARPTNNSWTTATTRSLLWVGTNNAADSQQFRVSITQGAQYAVWNPTNSDSFVRHNSAESAGSHAFKVKNSNDVATSHLFVDGADVSSYVTDGTPTGILVNQLSPIFLSKAGGASGDPGCLLIGNIRISNTLIGCD